MQPDSRQLKRALALMLISLCGCSVLPETNHFDWSGARPFTVSNRVPVEFNRDVTLWGVQYELDGVFKADLSTGLIHFRIDKLELNKNPKYPQYEFHLTSLQIGICHHLADGRNFGMSPNRPLGKTNSKDLFITIKPDKNYRIADFEAMSVLSDETFNLHESWPCSQLWATVTPSKEWTNERIFPAHEITHAAIL
ncbi:MAG TPA: hypothetical protein VF848_12215 [Steroidobacteraceae bacterium]